MLDYLGQQTRPRMSVSHFSQPTAFIALNREARGTHWEGITGLRGEQQHDVNSAGTPLLMAEKSEGLVIASLASAFRMNDTLRSTKELPFFPFPKPKRRFEDCKA